MAATSVPLHHPSSNADLSYETQPDEFAFTSPVPQDSSVYTGSIEMQDSELGDGKKDGQSEGPSSIYSQILSRKGFEWLLEVDDTEDNDFNKPLLWVNQKTLMIQKQQSQRNFHL